MKQTRFELSYFLNPNEKFHIARVNITSRYDLSCHSHDYAELFWVEKGEGFHFINGLKMKLEEGDLLMIRPDDSHTFIPNSRGLTIINIAFATDALNNLQTRYFPNNAIYFWSNARLPYHLRISQHVQKRLSSRAEEAIKYSRSNLQLDSLLLFIFRQLTANEMVDGVSDVPLWLFSAIQQYNNPDLFQKGINSFVTLCDRNISYINRTVRIHFGKTLTELINEAKMQYATTQLSLTDMPIKEICVNCGFRNMGHFYKVFKSVYAQTPFEYRRINQMIV